MLQPETLDLIMSLASIFFILGVLLQNIQMYKTKDATSMSYGLAFCNSFALTIVVLCMFGLGLWLSATVLSIQTVLWYSILFMKIIYERRKKNE